jgi:hypothetical protein
MVAPETTPREARLLGWVRVTPRLVLPERELAAIFQEAQNRTLHSGGRFGVPDRQTITLYDRPRRARGPVPRLQGRLRLGWWQPRPYQATLLAMEWRPAAGGALAPLAEALNALAGRRVIDTER